MVVLRRLSALALVACIALVPAAMADGSPSSPPPSGGGSNGCQSGGNCTAPPPNGTAPPPGGPAPSPASVTAMAEGALRTSPAGSCDLIRFTGDPPRVSVNPVLGIVTVNPGCILRWVHDSSPGIVR
jgi:hypothetical protein